MKDVDYNLWCKLYIIVLCHLNQYFSKSDMAFSMFIYIIVISDMFNMVLWLMLQSGCINNKL